MQSRERGKILSTALTPDETVMFSVYGRM